MLKPWIKTGNHEEIFAERYEWLMGWALRMTGHDQALAEDLVHDVFIHFVLHRPDLDATGQNLEGYLYTMLRNLHVSAVRRAARLRNQTVSISDFSLADYDSLENGLKAIEELTQARLEEQTREELRRICQYACLRKASSKAGSVLILRFFHGYYPSEIARVLRCSRGAVDVCLSMARREAKLFLTDPESLAFMPSGQGRTDVRAAEPPVTVDVVRDLRQFIFQSGTGECLAAGRWRELYAASDDASLDAATLSHLVSCPSCLDEVNRLLGLPPLSSRYPTNMLGKEPPTKGKGGGDSSGGGSGRVTAREFMKKSRRRMEDLLDHRPKEMRISVNGFILGSRDIGAEVNRQTILVKGEEKISFVEVFSEKEVRLLFCCVEPPPDGPVERRERISLSDGRTLEMILDFSDHWPTLEVVYTDCRLRIADRGLEERADSSGRVPLDARRHRTETHEARFPKLSSAIRNLQSAIRNPQSAIWRPMVMTAIVAALLAASLLMLRQPATTVSASALLARSRAAEGALEAQPDLITHRTLTLETRRPEAGRLLSHQRIEIWQSAIPVKGRVKARRVYDENNQLVAGEWIEAGGARAIYQQGRQGNKLQRLPADSQSADPPAKSAPEFPAGFDDLWQWEPSAQHFSNLVNRSEEATVEEQPSVFIISYHDKAADNQAGDAAQLVQASLTIDQKTLRAVGQTFVLRRGAEAREFRFIEGRYERQQRNEVNDAAFEPDAELASDERETERTDSKAIISPSHSLSVSPPPAVATAELEVEVTSLLNQAGAFLGEQIEMRRDAQGRLKVEAMVETGARKAELLRALGPVAEHRAVRIDIETFAEAARRQSATQPPASSPVIISQIEVGKEAIPVETELRQYLSRQRGIASEQMEQELRRFSQQMMNRSLRARMHALALKQIAGRFSPGEARALDPAAREKWLQMIRDHARSVQQETAALRRDLEQVFPAQAGEERGEIEAGTGIKDETDLAAAAKRLLELAVTNDEAVSRSFSIYTQREPAAPVRTGPFWRSLRAAEKLAAQTTDVR